MGLWFDLFLWPSAFVAVVLAIVLFFKSSKFYPVIYVISVWLYVFTISFLIDAFIIGYKFQKLGILAVLVVSAIIFMVLGQYFSKVLSEKKKK